jgi:hypothetical protein
MDTLLLVIKLAIGGVAGIALTILIMAGTSRAGSRLQAGWENAMGRCICVLVMLVALRWGVEVINLVCTP